MAQGNRIGVLAAVAAGGAIGTILRYELALAEPPGAGFPWATFAVNLVGALLLGVIVTVLTDDWRPSRYLRPFAAVGFCGGLTTFSTWMVESVLLVRDGSTATAVVYVGSSLVLGIVAVGVGILGARGLLHRVGPVVFDPRQED